jgi:hypothetical protein
MFAGVATGDCEIYVGSVSANATLLVHPSSLKYTPSHPNILQIRGAATSDGIHATLFHDGVAASDLEWIALSVIIELDLIPFENFVDLNRYIHFLTKYIDASWVCAAITSQMPNIDSCQAHGF